MKATQPLHRSATTTPNVIATIMGDRKRTWGEVRNRVARLAGALQKMGVGKGDRVGILALNSDRYLEFYFAVWWTGGAVVPMNLRWSPAENAYSLNDSNAKILFTDRAFTPAIPAIQAEAKDLETLVFLDDGDVPEGMLAYEDLIASNEPVADASGSGDDMAGIFYTGGTTGFPKGVVLPHRAIWFNGMACSKLFHIEAGDKYLHIAPMFHLADGAGSLATSMVGATHVFEPMFTPAGAIAACENYKPTHALMVPTMIGMVLADPSFSVDKLSSIKTLIYGASPMPEGLLIQTLKTLPSIGLVQGYGQTELAPIASVMPAAYHVLEGDKSGKLRSAGLPAYGVTIRIADEDGNDVPRGEVGEIVVSGPGTMTEYWNRPEETAAVLKDGEVYTGDGAYMDEDGFVFIVDRLKDMIITGGENVFSAEVENTLSNHPAVAGAVVIGIPSEKWGEAVHAIVIKKEGAEVTDQALMDFCKEHIANYKIPRSVEFRTEPFPLSGAGKIMKKDLREPYWKGHGRGVA